MKVIFLKDVPNVAKAGQLKEVSSGYGRNYLIPKKLATIANTAAISMVEAQQKVFARNQQQIEGEMADLAGQLEGRELFLKARAGTTDRLYGSITNADIAAELENSSGLVIDKRKIELADTINQLGSYEVTVRLTKDLTPKIKITVTEEEK